MIPKGTMAIVVDALAKALFRKNCDILDKSIERNLRKAFKNERISEIRIDRIIKNFSANMRGENNG